MLPRKNVFGYFAVSVYVISIIYALAGGISSIGAGKEYPYLLGGAFLALLLCGWLLMNGASGLAARLDPDLRLREASWGKYLEALIVICVLAAAAAIRVYVVRTVPMEPESDYKTYYEVAEYIARGTLTTQGTGYCDYISLFPHVYGYPYVLSLVFRIFGVSVAAALYFNVVLSVATVFLSYRAARTAGGRLCGLAALFLTAFWPSQIIYINMVASEYLFSFMLMLAVYLFVKSLRDDSGDIKHPVTGVLLHAFLGGWLALTAAIRPMALLLLITIFICIGFEKLRLPVRATKDQPVSLLILSKGWMRCCLVVVIYLGINGLITIGVTNAVDRDLVSGGASFGYNLLVGLNAESEGGWNQEDADLLDTVLAQTGSATQAHAACLDLAVQRLSNVEGTANLLFLKFQNLWMNDDYGATTNLVAMEGQGTLTDGMRGFLYAVRDWGNVFYLLIAALAAVEGIFLWRNGPGLAYPFLLMYLGTVAMHLLVESQNRYHFHALYMLAILAALGVRDVCEASRVRVQQRLEERRRLAEREREDAEKKEALLREEETVRQLREEAMRSGFNMTDALEKGYVTVRVSGIYAEGEKDRPPEKDKANQGKDTPGAAGQGEA